MLRLVAITISKIQKTQAHARFMVILAFEEALPDHLTLAADLAWGLGRQAQFDEECFSRLTWFDSRDEQTAAADILGVTEEGFISISTGYLLHD